MLIITLEEWGQRLRRQRLRRAILRFCLGFIASVGLVIALIGLATVMGA